MSAVRNTCIPLPRPMGCNTDNRYHSVLPVYLKISLLGSNLMEYVTLYLLDCTIDFIWKYVFYSVFHKVWPSSREDEDYRAISSLINRFYYFLCCCMHHSTLFVISRFTSIFRRSPLRESCSIYYFLSLPLHFSFSRILWRTYIRTHAHTYTRTFIHTHVHTYTFIFYSHIFLIEFSI